MQKFLDAEVPPYPDQAAVCDQMAPAEGIVQNIGARARILDEPPVVNLSPDFTDNPILADAVAGKVNLIVSGDKRHMLALGKVKGIPVVTAREALARVSHLFTHLD